LEDKDHLFLGEDAAAVVHEERGCLALGRKRLLSLERLLIDLGLGGLVLLTLLAAAAAECLVHVGEGLLASHNTFWNELGRFEVECICLRIAKGVKVG
jgi:hypothetical protein